MKRGNHYKPSYIKSILQKYYKQLVNKFNNLMKGTNFLKDTTYKNKKHKKN